jgi:hypothetical protein
MTARAIDQILKGVSASLQGKTRGPDHDPEGHRRTPHRNSFDVDDARAKPWRPIGDGSVRQGMAYREALTEAAGELYEVHYQEYPFAKIREANARQAELSAELDRYAAGEVAAIGRPAVVRRELDQVTTYLKAAAGRLRRVDKDVLKALLRNIDFATGRLFPAIETIAEWAGCHRNSVIAALRRLRDHGFIGWVRRSIRTGNDGEFAPQREQTSNAYEFAPRGKMTNRVFQRYWQRVIAKLRKLGALPASVSADGPREVQDPALREALASLGTTVSLLGNAST